MKYNLKIFLNKYKLCVHNIYKLPNTVINWERKLSSRNKFLFLIEFGKAINQTLSRYATLLDLWVEMVAVMTNILHFPPLLTKFKEIKKEAAKTSKFGVHLKNWSQEINDRYQSICQTIGEHSH